LGESDTARIIKDQMHSAEETPGFPHDISLLGAGGAAAKSLFAPGPSAREIEQKALMDLLMGRTYPTQGTIVPSTITSPLISPEAGLGALIGGLPNDEY
jgi:hypothetical protein